MGSPENTTLPAVEADDQRVWKINEFPFGLLMHSRESGNDHPTSGFLLGDPQVHSLIPTCCTKLGKPSIVHDQRALGVQQTVGPPQHIVQRAPPLCEALSSACPRSSGHREKEDPLSLVVQWKAWPAVVYPIVFGASSIPGGAELRPSTCHIQFITV